MPNPLIPATRVNRIVPEDGLEHVEMDGGFEFKTDEQAVAFVLRLVAQNALQEYGLAPASQAEMEAGTLEILRAVSPLRVKQAILALATIPNITGLQTALDTKAAKGANTDITSLTLGGANSFEPNAGGDGFYLKAQGTISIEVLSSGAILSGIPTAPTAAPGVSTTQIATTAYVIAMRDVLINSAPGVLDTFGELAAQMATDETAAAALVTVVSGKAAKGANTDIDSLTLAAGTLGAQSLTFGGIGGIWYDGSGLAFNITSTFQPFRLTTEGAWTLTPSQGDNTLRVPTTAFVQTAVAVPQAAAVAAQATADAGVAAAAVVATAAAAAAAAAATASGDATTATTAAAAASAAAATATADAATANGNATAAGTAAATAQTTANNAASDVSGALSSIGGHETRIAALEAYAAAHP